MRSRPADPAGREAKETPMVSTDQTNDVIHTPDGLPGFATARSWVLERAQPDAVFGVLRNVDVPAVGLLVTEPWDLAPGYEPDLPVEELARIGIDSPDQATVLVVATIADDASTVWLNLAAPIAVNVDDRRARQVILDRQGWPLRHAVSVRG
jgi:flagellar assembly factor FliW